MGDKCFWTLLFHRSYWNGLTWWSGQASLYYGVYKIMVAGAIFDDSGRQYILLCFVIIRSMHMLLLEAALVGAETSWDNCSWFMQSVSLIAFAFWLELLTSQFRSPRMYNWWPVADIEWNSSLNVFISSEVAFRWPYTREMSSFCLDLRVIVNATWIFDLKHISDWIEVSYRLLSIMATPPQWLVWSCRMIFLL